MKKQVVTFANALELFWLKTRKVSEQFVPPSKKACMEIQISLAFFLIVKSDKKQ
jgi:hypothetical protein